MGRLLVLALALSMFSGSSLAAQQVYVWTDEYGNREYRDTPPPPSAKNVERRDLGVSTIETSGYPYNVQQAINNFPVTLWTTDCGVPCNQARALLVRRGVPYTEKDAQKEAAAFSRLVGGREVPVLFVGSTPLRGFQENEWEAALDAAGYPKTATAYGRKPASKPAPAPENLPAVKLYTHPECGAPCGEAKTLLSSRGVHFQEVVAQDPATIKELQTVAGVTRVPVLVVGQSVMRGFNASAYNDKLDSAGFPRK
jgi:glutaredoxin